MTPVSRLSESEAFHIDRGVSPVHQAEADMERCVLTLSVVLLLAGVSNAATGAPSPALLVPEGGLIIDGGDVEAARAAEGPGADPWRVEGIPPAPSFAASVAAATSDSPASGGSQAPPARRPVAFEYSEGYQTRLKIHKYASYATLPLFVAQFAVGQKLYNGNGSDGTRTAHGVLAGGTAVLFGVNTVTGVWNLSEGRKDPNHHTKRMVHGILMAVADAGFVATGILTPHEGHEEGEFTYQESGGTSRSTHRAVALTSMGIATVAYLMMLIH
jgi:hypothetical protein